MNKKTILSLITITFLTLYGGQAIAQSQSINSRNISIFDQPSTNENIQYKTELPPFKDNIPKYSEENEYLLKDLLKKENYIDFYKAIISIPIKKEAFLKFLLENRFEGHVPVYWMLTDYYSKEGMAEETHKWYYIALIMTQQDSYLCIDTSAKGTPRYLMKFYMEALSLTRKTPQYIDPAMREVVFFLDNLKTRSHPSWVCRYGQITGYSNPNGLIDKNNWKETRATVLKRFTDSMNTK